MPTVPLAEFEAILFDLNGTLAEGYDRFGPEQDYHATYRRLGGRRLDAAMLRRWADLPDTDRDSIAEGVGPRAAPRCGSRLSGPGARSWRCQEPVGDHRVHRSWTGHRNWRTNNERGM